MYDPQLRLCEALRQHKPIFGSWLQTGAPAAAEILSEAGFAWLGLDCEHTSADISTVEETARTLHNRNTALLVRISRSDTLEIRKCLDVGAGGVIVPLVETAEQARMAVSAAKYPPTGNRGFCFGRMNQWGVQFDDYARTANDRTIVVVMIESRRGVENIDEILAVEGIDGVFIGPYDLSGSYGVPGKTDHELVLKARARVLTACNAAGVSAGLHIVRSTPAQIESALKAGFTFLCLDADIIFLDRAARASLESATRPIITPIPEKIKNGHALRPKQSTLHV